MIKWLNVCNITVVWDKGGPQGNPEVEQIQTEQATKPVLRVRSISGKSVAENYFQTSCKIFQGVYGTKTVRHTDFITLLPAATTNPIVQKATDTPEHPKYYIQVSDYETQLTL